MEGNSAYPPPPVPMMDPQNHHQAFYYTPYPQQVTTAPPERIGGDGEEVYGEHNYVTNPPGPQMMMPPQPPADPFQAPPPVYDPYYGSQYSMEAQYHQVVNNGEGSLGLGGELQEDNRRTGDGEEVYGYNGGYSVPPMPMMPSAAVHVQGTGLGESVQQEIDSVQDSQPVSLSSVDNQGAFVSEVPEDSNNRRTGDGEEVYDHMSFGVSVNSEPLVVQQGPSSDISQTQQQVAYDHRDQDSHQPSSIEGNRLRDDDNRRTIDGETRGDRSRVREYDERRTQKDRHVDRDKGTRGWDRGRRDSSSSSIERRSVSPRGNRRTADGGTTRHGRDEDDEFDDRQSMHRRRDNHDKDRSRRDWDASRRDSSPSSTEPIGLAPQDRRRRVDGGSKRDRDRERDYDDYDRSHNRTRDGREHDKGKDRERSRRERDWETSRDYRRSGRRDFDFDDEFDRPHSRSSYHEDEYYSGRRRRRGESDSYRPRGPPSEYGSIRGGYPRDGRQYGYTDYGPPSGSLGWSMMGRSQMPSTGTIDPYAVTSHAQSFQMYLTTFRSQNPAAYREWYEKYRAHLQDPGRNPFPPVPGYPGIAGKVPATGAPAVVEKARPQSGRSSVLDEALAVGGDNSMFRPISSKKHEEPSAPSRSTPPLYTLPHSIVRISSLGHVLLSRMGASNLELIKMKGLMKRLPEYKEVKAFPGPLIKDVTHKNTVIQFCQRKIRELELSDGQLDRPHLILLWELLILLLRQNGSAIGSDIAELLLKSKSAGQSSDSSHPSSDDDYSERDETAEGHRPRKTVKDVQSNESDQKAVEVFCDKLLYGHKREALEYAMDNALWGHALFFASKMDEKLYGTVLARFANNTMSLNSPLQTLYHVLCGKQPPSVTCCGDESFGDWKPHLAVLLSNMGQRPEFEANTMRIMGNTLASRGMKFAAQFCYLMAESEFAEDSDMGLLLGYNPSTHNVLEATQMTEIYEFARSLANSDFTLGSSFIQCKLKYTTELLNLGFIQEAFAYCEEMTKSLRKITLRSKERTLAMEILRLSEPLVNCDVSQSQGSSMWLEELGKMANQIESETTSRKLSLATSSSDTADDRSSNVPAPYFQPSSTNQQSPPDGTSTFTSTDAPQVPMFRINAVGDSSKTYTSSSIDPQHSSRYSSMPSFDSHIATTTQQNGYQQQRPSFQDLSAVTPSDNNNYWASTHQTPANVNAISADSHAPPTSTFKAIHQQSGFNEQPVSNVPRPQQPTSKPAEKKKSEDKSKQNKKGGGGLSGIFSFLSFKPKNQMILPDDKDPSIVWDEATKSWKNVQGDEDEDTGPKGPPPKDSELMQSMSGGALPVSTHSFPHASLPAQAPAASTPSVPASGLSSHPSSSFVPQSAKMNGGPMSFGGTMPNPPALLPNKFQRPKGLKLRNNYVDIFNQNPSSQNRTEEPNVPLPVTQPPGSGMPNIFMPPPGPVDSGPMSFLTPSAEGSSSLGEDSYADQAAAPPMFNPAQFQQKQMVPNYGR